MLATGVFRLGVNARRRGVTESVVMEMSGGCGEGEPRRAEILDAFWTLGPKWPVKQKSLLGYLLRRLILFGGRYAARTRDLRFRS